MAEAGTNTRNHATKPVLIIGAGVVGLTIAQGCRGAGIPFQIFERHEASSERSQGWSLSLHWSLRSLGRTIGPELEALLPQVSPAAYRIEITSDCLDQRRPKHQGRRRGIPISQRCDLRT